MPEYAINVLGLDLSFKTDVAPERVHQAVDLIHRRYNELVERAGTMSKERLLTYLVLGLAGDYLHDQEKLQHQEEILRQLLSKIDGPED